jgi:osmotically-inducible protein OsmY
MGFFFSKRIAIFIIGLSLLISGGCATVYQETAARVWQDRSGQDQKVDLKIHTSILDRLSDKDKGLLLDVSADVWEQRVMLTGTLDDPGVHKEVLKLAKQDDRIKELYDHIQIVTKEEKEARRKQKENQEQNKVKEGEKSGVGQTVDDFWIETKIKAQLLTGQNVTSVNYFYRSVKNNVYVVGKAKSQFEKDKVLQIIKDTKGVTSVTEHIEVVSEAAY